MGYEKPLVVIWVAAAGCRLSFIITPFPLLDWLNLFLKVFIWSFWGYWSIFSTQWVPFQGRSSSAWGRHAASFHNVNYESANIRCGLETMTCSGNEMLTEWKISSWAKAGREGFNVNDTSCWCAYLSVRWGSSHRLLIWSRAETLWWERGKGGAPVLRRHVLGYFQ